MKPGDLVKLNYEYIDHTNAGFNHDGCTGIIIVDMTEADSCYGSDRLFKIMICDRIFHAFDYELEVISETR